ncbi:SAM-dependent methyltransferase [Ameyamaea chiangmaiensis NBRC 103196]|nr:SAM-dependent methyltransferase [Ameyamaea chiangmaiensis NBRC 103196]
MDLGCGGGHVSYRLAPHVTQVVACDVTPPMLRAVEHEAAQRGLTNIATSEAPAERLPFSDGMFDGVFCRFSTHHWTDLEAGLREARRVLAPGGIGVFVDVTAPASAMADSWLQTLELLRDIAHVRDYSVAEWTGALTRSGFAIRPPKAARLRMAFENWVARTRTPEERVAAIRSLQRQAPAEVTQALAIESDGSFTLDVSTFEVEPAG